MQDVEASRPELMAAHEEAKRRRDAAPLGSDEFARSAQEVARIEVEIAAIVEQAAAQKAADHGPGAQEARR